MRAFRHRTVSLIGALSLCATLSSHGSAENTDDLPTWVKETGARLTPVTNHTVSVNRCGAIGDGRTNSTKAIQRAIDECAQAGGGSVTFESGQYLTGALFLKSNVNFIVGKDVTLLGSQEDADYPSLPTRVAGIEMKWPAGLINVNGQTNVKISGGGVIDGRGQKWWQRYETLRKAYEPRGLRWAADYDAERVRLMVVSQSLDVAIENLSLKRSGFWTLQLLYSEHVTVERVSVSDNAGPSTDGVDIDSSRYVCVSHCDIDNNDDDICLKSGRDADGLRVNCPTEYIYIHDNVTRRGGGVVSLGSETSGGIRHVVAYRNRGIGTKEGVRFKSAKTRGGYIEDVLIRDLKLENVPLAFTFTLNWNPSYSYATIPKDTQEVPAHWRALAAPVTPPERGIAEFRNIVIEDVEIRGAKRILTASGLAEKPLTQVRFANIQAEGNEAGSIEYARDWKMDNVTFTTLNGAPLKLAHCENMGTPQITGRQPR